MNLVEVFTKYPDHAACIEHLEELRFGDSPYCPHCGSSRVARKADNGRVGRWNCHECRSSFNVLSGTLFQGTKVQLQLWFLAISLMVNAKKSISSCQLARDLDVNQKTAWYMQQRIRAEMASKQQEIVLQGVIEADETWIGGKPRKPNRRDDDGPGAPRGRATAKTPVIGAVERGGKVVAEVARDLTGKGILKFIRKSVDTSGSLLITDEYRAYNAARRMMPHSVVNHRREYASGSSHTNTIEGVWSLLKRAWYGSHHHYAKEWLPLYVAEACWKYNNRRERNAFGQFMQGCFA
ncbi:MAG: IS1595 family transposase [Anaerolineaceae bacterium]|nr:IS1595 family transposase [Anaerolineaceae bacterium]